MVGQEKSHETRYNKRKKKKKREMKGRETEPAPLGGSWKEEKLLHPGRFSPPVRRSGKIKEEL